MKKIRFRLEKLLSKKYTPLFGFLAVIICEIIFMFLTPAFTASSNGEELIDLKYLYNADQIIASLSNYTPKTFTIHFYIRIVDSFLPLSYMVFFSSTLFWLFNSLSQHKNSQRLLRLKRIYLLPVAAAFFDYCENILIMHMTSSFPVISPLTARISGIFSLLKYTSIGFSILLILFLLFIKLRQKVQG